MTAAGPARIAAIVGRFPRHLALDEPGKVIGDVVGALADGLDEATRDLGRVRRAHRVVDVDEEADLLAHAALHDFGTGAFELVRRRTASAGGPLRYADELTLVREALAALIGAHRTGNGTVGHLLAATAAYLGLTVEEVAHAAGGWWHMARCRDLVAARAAATGPAPGSEPAPAAPLTPLTFLAVEENPLRDADLAPRARRPRDAWRILRGGLDDVEVTVVVRGVDDRTVAPMVVNTWSGEGVAYLGAVPAGQELRFGVDGRVTLGDADVTASAYSFRGAVWADAAAQVRRGAFVFADAAAEGGADAEPGPAVPSGPSAGPGPHPASRPGRFAVSHPLADAFATAAAFPHDGSAIEPPGLPTGESHWAFFTGLGTFAGEDESGATVPAEPRFRAGRFDETVFDEVPVARVAPQLRRATGLGRLVLGRGSAGPRDAPLALPPASSPLSVSTSSLAPAPARPPLPVGGEVGFEWREHEPFAVRVWLPLGLADLDTDGSPTVADAVRVLLDRHRAAGVHLATAYADDRWTLGEGVLRDLGSGEPEGVVFAGTRPWTDGTDQPAPTS